MKPILYTCIGLRHCHSMVNGGTLFSQVHEYPDQYIKSLLWAAPEVLQQVIVLISLYRLNHKSTKYTKEYSWIGYSSKISVYSKICWHSYFWFQIVWDRRFVENILTVKSFFIWIIDENEGPLRKFTFVYRNEQLTLIKKSWLFSMIGVSESEWLHNK